MEVLVGMTMPDGVKVKLVIDRYPIINSPRCVFHVIDPVPKKFKDKYKAGDEYCSLTRSILDIAPDEIVIEEKFVDMFPRDRLETLIFYMTGMDILHPRRVETRFDNTYSIYGILPVYLEEGGPE